MCGTVGHRKWNSLSVGLCFAIRKLSKDETCGCLLFVLQPRMRDQRSTEGPGGANVAQESGHLS